MQTTDRPKDPARVAAGKAAIRKRWGPTRIVRLDQVDADTARLIRALLAQAENKATAPAVEKPEAVSAAEALTDAPDAA